MVKYGLLVILIAIHLDVTTSLPWKSHKWKLPPLPRERRIKDDIMLAEVRDLESLIESRIAEDDEVDNRQADQPLSDESIPSLNITDREMDTASVQKDVVAELEDITSDLEHVIERIEERPKKRSRKVWRAPWC